MNYKGQKGALGSETEIQSRKSFWGTRCLQENLAQTLERKAAERTHYLSLVYHLPDDIRQRIDQECSTWADLLPNTGFYKQRSAGTHLTLIELKEVDALPFSISEVVFRINKAIATYKKPTKLQVTFGAPQIGRSGINLTLTCSEDLLGLVHQLQLAFPECYGEVNPSWYRRGISLVRYLKTNETNKQHLNRLIEGELNSKLFGLDLTIDQLALVQLDKVAEYFSVKHRFTLGYHQANR